MFEVGFSELLLIMALALIVLGPEKLPKVASQVGRWMGRARAMARQFRETLEEEVQLEETNRRSKASSGGGGKTAATPAPDAAATAAAAAGGLAGEAGPTADSRPGGDGATTTDVDADTRHSDYAGAAWEPPTSIDAPADPPTSPDTAPGAFVSSAAAALWPAGDPGTAAAAGAPTDDISGPRTADAHGQRGT